jgi:hypothetical protein
VLSEAPSSAAICLLSLLIRSSAREQSARARSTIRSPYARRSAIYVAPAAIGIASELVAKNVVEMPEIRVRNPL